MSGLGLDHAGRRDSHAAQPELHGEPLRHADAVDRVVEVDLGALGRWRWSLRRRRDRGYRLVPAMLIMALRQTGARLPRQSQERDRPSFFRLANHRRSPPPRYS